MHADVALKAVSRFWFAAVVAGQWLFLYYIVAFYGTSTLQGNFAAWKRNFFLFKGYVAGDTAGNLAFAAHALLAAVIAFGGALQLAPLNRAFHRWNGRLFLLTAFGVSLSGLYLVWVRGTRANPINSIAISIDAVLILVFGALALRTAMTRDFEAHRRWALRTFVVANGQWFFRIGLVAWLVVNGPVGTTKRLDGPFDYFWAFGSYLVPLAVVELHLRVRTPRARAAMATGLLLLTVAMSIGILGIWLFLWQPILTSGVTS